MTLPPPPDSFFEGGDAQSQVDPGDTGRELLHEVKNLATGVALLRNVVLKQRARQRQTVVMVAIAVVTMFLAMAYSHYLSVESAQDRLVSAHDGCESDNARSAIEIDLLEASLALNKDEQRTAFLQPRIDQFKALIKDCDALYPDREDLDGYPSFWSRP